uniref:Uncharacterized protein n=1 Tax=Trichogramma kaykai TaxID=54128 RepID=A0ABD2VW56_9HYME
MDEEAAFDAAYVEMIFDKLVRDSQWVEELMHSSRDSLMIKGSLDLLISQVDEKVAEKSNEDDLLERAREGQKLLDLKLQEVEEARKSRAEHEAGLKAQFFKLKASAYYILLHICVYACKFLFDVSTYLYGRR